MVDVIHSNTHFLQRGPLYDTEKPYSLRFTPPDGFPRANINLERHDIDFHDIRKRVSTLDFRRDGYPILGFDSKMTCKDYDDDEVVKEILLKEIANALKTFLGAQHVQIFEHTVRKRHETFPISTGEPYQYNQPTSIAHVDTTTEWAVAMARQLNPQRRASLGEHRIQCVNFWKPISGPVQDWPLGMCNPRTLEADVDLEHCDLVYPDYVVENRQVYFSPRQRWVYLSDQMPNEAWVFLQADTDAEGGNPVAHTAFPIPCVGPSDALPRESIEARALVYYGGFEDER